ncbi:Trans-aconitate methyltransferase [Planctomycetales bacterium 10988]|nr:Trans-aconitate methyltransferase [Planctomycetales bacterium 10988]
MLLTMTTIHAPATDLGFLLHKHPDRFQSFSLSVGKAHVFYPEARADRCTACLLLEIDPVAMVRRRGQDQPPLLDHYVNDRPYVASSLMSVAMSRVFGTALSGNCQHRPALVGQAIDLSATIDVLPVRGGEAILHRLFEPLGYEIEATRHPFDEQFPEWGESPYYSVTIRGRKTVSELLRHLYVLIPVFDNEKHYFVGEDELEKLLAKGEGWLTEHPEKEMISKRYLKYRSSLYRQALDSLLDESEQTTSEVSWTPRREESLEASLSLNEQRHGTVLAALRASGAKRVVDLGCGEGKLLRELLKEKQFEQILGMDVSVRSLEITSNRLKLDRLSEKKAARIKLMHGSLMYRDRRLEGWDAAAVVEVIEHLNPPRIQAFERVLFEFAKPTTIVLTTPNREYNIVWESLPAGSFRHADHRFEWTREEFRTWAKDISKRYAYHCRFISIGPEYENYGPPTQMVVFERVSAS